VNRALYTAVIATKECKNSSHKYKLLFANKVTDLKKRASPFCQTCYKAIMNCVSVYSLPEQRFSDDSELKFEILDRSELTCFLLARIDHNKKAYALSRFTGGEGTASERVWKKSRWKRRQRGGSGDKRNFHARKFREILHH